jgi:hypothetical protein
MGITIADVWSPGAVDQVGYPFDHALAITYLRNARRDHVPRDNL